jgi:hypothetical protein
VYLRVSLESLLVESYNWIEGRDEEGEGESYLGGDRGSHGDVSCGVSFLSSE